MTLQDLYRCNVVINWLRCQKIKNAERLPNLRKATSGVSRLVLESSGRIIQASKNSLQLYNLREADKEAQDGKVKKNRFIRRHNLHPEEDLRALQLMILTLDFPAPDYSVMRVKSDAGKVRDIVKQKYFPWRILHHAIMRVIEEDVYRNLIYDTSACIKGKGLHFGVRRMKRFLHRYPEYKWFVKTDFKKFYQSILHELIVAALRRKFKDERFIKLIEIAVLSYDSGTELVDVLENEVERKKRCSDWSIYKPTYREFCGKPDRSYNEGEISCQMPA